MSGFEASREFDVSLAIISLKWKASLLCTIHVVDTTYTQTFVADG